jgi:ABC-2 type transport system permease protein
MISAARAESSPAFERMGDGRGAFLASVLSFAWLEFRALRYYPSNMALSVVQGIVQGSVWYFIARFLSGAADAKVAAYGGSYVAYVVIGVVYFQAGTAALNGPFETISTAFWDKRLEGYHLAPRGVWAHVLGRTLWKWGYATILQATVLGVIVAFGGIGSSLRVQFLPALLSYALFVAAVFGLGLCGASLFFLLEVKQGREPIGWLVSYAVQITSGVYVPVATLPLWLRDVGYLLPHTYGLAAMRGALLPGDVPLWSNIAILAGFAVVTLALGVRSFHTAIRSAEAEGGVGVVV